MLLVARSCACSALVARRFASMSVASVNGVPIYYKLHEPAASQVSKHAASGGTVQPSNAGHSLQQAHLQTANAHPLHSGAGRTSSSANAHQGAWQPGANPSPVETSSGKALSPAGLQGSHAPAASPSPLSHGADDVTSPAHAAGQGSPPRVLFICGLDARHDTEYFRHLIAHLTAQGCAVCSFDNRCVWEGPASLCCSSPS